MIDKLQAEADDAATKKAYCDKEMGETEKQKVDKEDDIEKMNVKIDVMTSSSRKLKGDVARLQKELGDAQSTQAQMDKTRAEEKSLYKKDKPEMEQGLEGIKKALEVLRDYYSKGDDASSSGAGGGREDSCSQTAGFQDPWRALQEDAESTPRRARHESPPGLLHAREEGH